MLRRDLIRSIFCLPMLRDNHMPDVVHVPVTEKHIMMFCDSRSVNIDALVRLPAPAGVAIDIIPLKLRPGQTIEDAVRLYEVRAGESLDAES